jgi:hypothetical protein
MLQDTRQPATTTRSGVASHPSSALSMIPSRDLDIDLDASPSGRILDDVAGRVDDVIAAFLDDRCAGLAEMDRALVPVADSVRRLVTAGGKRLRPAFVWWGTGRPVATPTPRC